MRSQPARCPIRGRSGAATIAARSRQRRIPVARHLSSREPFQHARLRAQWPGVVARSVRCFCVQHHSCGAATPTALWGVRGPEGAGARMGSGLKPIRRATDPYGARMRSAVTQSSRRCAHGPGVAKTVARNGQLCVCTHDFRMPPPDSRQIQVAKSGQRFRAHGNNVCGAATSTSL